MNTSIKILQQYCQEWLNLYQTLSPELQQQKKEQQKKIQKFLNSPLANFEEKSSLSSATKSKAKALYFLELLEKAKAILGSTALS